MLDRRAGADHFNAMELGSSAVAACTPLELAVQRRLLAIACRECSVGGAIGAEAPVLPCFGLEGQRPSAHRAE